MTTTTSYQTAVIIPNKILFLHLSCRRGVVQDRRGAAAASEAWRNNPEPGQDTKWCQLAGRSRARDESRRDRRPHWGAGQDDPVLGRAGPAPRAGPHHGPVPP